MELPRPRAIRQGLAVYCFGDGEPTLLVPGPHRFQRPGLRSADALIEGLLGLGRSVVTFDPPGSGNSTRPADLGMSEMHSCVDEALDACGVTGPVDALGHSMAGLVLLAYLLDRPQRLHRVVLVGTGSGGPAYMRAPGAMWNSGHRAFPAVAALGSLHLLLRRRGSERALTNLIERHSFHDRRQARPEHPSGRVTGCCRRRATPTGTRSPAGSTSPGVSAPRHAPCSSCAARTTRSSRPRAPTSWRPGSPGPASSCSRPPATTPSSRSRRPSGTRSGRSSDDPPPERPAATHRRRGSTRYSGGRPPGAGPGHRRQASSSAALLAPPDPSG